MLLPFAAITFACYIRSFFSIRMEKAASCCVKDRAVNSPQQGKEEEDSEEEPGRSRRARALRHRGEAQQKAEEKHSKKKAKMLRESYQKKAAGLSLALSKVAASCLQQQKKFSSQSTLQLRACLVGPHLPGMPCGGCGVR